MQHKCSIKVNVTENVSQEFKHEKCSIKVNVTGNNEPRKMRKTRE